MDAAPRLQGKTRPAAMRWASRASPASAAASTGPCHPHKRPEPPEAASASATPPSCSRPARHGAAPAGRGTGRERRPRPRWLGKVRLGDLA
ncbi:rCG53691 [Rattus norvegicus]|uniref:RCG53691 n=1 Tax=Rattus norvegicus TaxID=10116 RepID=A6JA78_RAT|nr:rCG53691 [Rattus norvegicus]